MDTLAMSDLCPGEIREDQDFSNQDFSNQDLTDCEFTNCDFRGSHFRGADLSGCVFFHCEFNDAGSENAADFGHAKLREASFERCNLTVVDFSGCRGYGLRFSDCQMQGTDFAKSDFRLPVADTDLVEFVITNCNLSFRTLETVIGDTLDARATSLIVARFFGTLLETSFGSTNLTSFFLCL